MIIFYNYNAHKEAEPLDPQDYDLYTLPVPLEPNMKLLKKCRL
jgi:hypothetical protein